MFFIDTHAHLYGPEYADDLDEVVDRARAVGVGKILLPNINEESVASMMKLCAGYPHFFYPMIGLHPEDVTPDYREVLSRMCRLFDQEPSFVAVGEVGLDFYWDKTYCREQIAAFEMQVEWAMERGLPLMIHTRSAQKELVQVLKHYGQDRLRGVFHCFGGTLDEAHELLDFKGFSLGINGLVTFKKATLPDVLREIPLERIVLETDAPYLTPVPHRGKRNESAYLLYTLKKVAEIYGLSEETVARQTTENVRRIFKIEDEMTRNK